MLTAPNISYLTNIYFDFGALAVLPGLLKKHKIDRPLVITDKGLVSSGIIDKIGLEHPIVFDQVETNPTEAMAVEALGIYINSGCDGIVAVGGGSPIDLAKCLRILVHHPPPLEQYAIRSGGISKISSK